MWGFWMQVQQFLENDNSKPPIFFFFFLFFDKYDQIFERIYLRFVV